MTQWSKYPFVRILIPFALGIWLRVFFQNIELPNWTLFAVMLALFAMALMAVYQLKSYRFVWLFGAIMACYLVIAGYALTRFHEASVHKDYYRNYEADARYYVARVFEYPTERENNVKVQLELQCQFGDSVPSQTVSGHVMAYFQKSDAALALQYGDLLVLPAPVGEVSPPQNPEEFDYRAFLMRRGITGQVFLKEQDWMSLDEKDANPLFAFSYRFRDKLTASLRKCGLKDHEFGVAAAILLGYDDFLEDEMRQKYVAAGSMHILCVSGMHVGIIYLLASLMLGFLRKKEWHKALRNILLLAILWFYALIAGLSPSILRAALMLSFVIVGDLLHRKGFAINSIAASAFVLLCVNPMNLFELGFLLSYSAVVGIVVLQRPIYGLIYVKNKLLNKIWNITAVALAAQVATIPFTLFYFRQFTTYFWLSNLFMTPISFVVVMGGMLLLLLSWVPYVNLVLGYLVWGMIYLMNRVVVWIDGLPFSIIKGLYISPLEFVLLLTAFVLLLLLVTFRKKRMVFEFLTVMLLFMLSLTVRLYRADNHGEIAFFSLRKHTAVDFIMGHQHLLLADSTLMDDVATMDYSMEGLWARKHLSRRPEWLAFDADYCGPFLRKKENLISFGGKLLALWPDDNNVSDSLSYRLPVDYLLVTERVGENHKPNLASVVKGYEVGLLLIDGSVPHYKAKEWKAQAQALNLSCYDLSEGALVLDLSP